MRSDRTEIFAAVRSLAGKFEIAASVRTILSNAFAGCESLTGVTFANPSGLEAIGQTAFFGSGLTELDVPDTVKSIGVGAFKQCWKLKRVSFSLNPRLGSLANSAFAQKALESFEGPPKLALLGEKVFACTSLLTASFGPNVSALPRGLFEDCKKLLEHPGVIGFIGFYGPGSGPERGPAIITEWAERGSLANVLGSKTESARLTTTIKMRIVGEFGKGTAKIGECGDTLPVAHLIINLLWGRKTWVHDTHSK
jgi:hypothetical protein